MGKAKKPLMNRGRQRSLSRVSPNRPPFLGAHASLRHAPCEMVAVLVRHAVDEPIIDA